MAAQNPSTKVLSGAGLRGQVAARPRYLPSANQDQV